jgi:epoxyqueuosine reductase
MSWLKNNLEVRSNPKNIWNDARSAIILGINYSPGYNPLFELKNQNKAYLSVYSRRRDYHKVIKSKLKALAAFIKHIVKTEVKVFVDTAPLMEKPLANLAGLGWQGKHTNLVSRKFGSWLFLGVILTNLDLDMKNKIKGSCGSCSSCITVCPTKAIIKPYVLDARKCISYLTIEHKTHISKKFRRKMGNRIFGCDDCLAVCPWNKFAKKYKEIKLNLIKKLNLPDLKTFLKFQENDFKDYFLGTPIRRLGYDRFMRNVLIAAGNSKEPKLVNYIIDKLNNDNELVRAMAVWAMYCLDKNKFFVEKTKRYHGEKSIEVRKEWLNGEKI